MIRRAQPWLGTLVDITAHAALPDAAMQAGVDRAFNAVAQIHRLMSFHDADSDVGRLNRAMPGTLTEVDPHTWAVLQLAERLRCLSDGLFNVACAPQLVAWGYLPSPGGMPTVLSDAPVLRCAAEFSVEKLALGWIDLGGIAKGYAVDQAVAVLRDAGVEAGCVNAGGDLRVFGDPAVTVAVRDPRRAGQVGAEMVLRDEALATSGAYFTAKLHAGSAVSALVDGRNGRALVDQISVSVRAPSCALADALTKVVAASGDRLNPALAAFGATASII